MDIVTDSFEYYDANFEKYDDIIKSIKNIELDLYEGTCKIYDKNNNIIYSSTYEILGKYDSHNKIWIWSWAVSYFPKKITNISRKIIKYAVDIDYSTRLYLKTELVTSRFKISNELQLDLHKALSSYISKQPFCFLVTHINDRTFIVSDDLKVGDHFLLVITNFKF